MSGELRELTVLFCDLRGFTALSERLDHAVLTRVANQFFEVATEAIQDHGGTIDKYIGDAIMAFWNAPADQPDHAALACRAALRILEKVAISNESLAPRGGLPRLAVGIGINTGPCTVGNFGSSRRFDYSAIGDPVNVAARLEGETNMRWFRELRATHLQLRAASLAGDGENVQRFLDELRKSAPAGLKALYDALERRAVSTRSQPPGA